MNKNIVKKLSPPSELPDWIEEYFVNFCRVTSLGYLSSSIMHEIGNAMTVVSGNAQIMQIKKDDITREDIFKRIDLMMSQVERIQNAIHKVGSFSSRAKGGGALISPERSLDNSLYAFEHRNDISDLRIEKNIHPEDATITIDPSVLEYIILELLSLFVDSTHSNGSLKIYSGRDETAWFLSADFTPAVDTSKTIQAWKDVESGTSLVAALYALKIFGGRAELTADDNVIGWNLVVPFEKGSK